jgi:hypothetical protein
VRLSKRLKLPVVLFAEVLTIFPVSGAFAFEPVAAAMPPDERAFIAAVEDARDAYKAGANDLAKGAARPWRARKVCAALGGSPSIRGWIGNIYKLSTNSEGKGVVEFEIAKDTFLKTWNNALSDTGSGTLIEPGSALYSQALGLKENMPVRFWGTFIASDADCAQESSISISGSMTEPAYIVKFSSIRSTDDVASEPAVPKPQTRVPAPEPRVQTEASAPRAKPVAKVREPAPARSEPKRKSGLSGMEISPQ